MNLNCLIIVQSVISTSDERYGILAVYYDSYFCLQGTLADSQHMNAAQKAALQVKRPIDF